MLRESGHTKRFHTVPTIGEQSVAEHSFHVAMLCIELMDGKASANLLKAALFHDLAETSTGDVPAHVKWANPDLKQLLESLEDKFNVDNKISIELLDTEKLALSLADSYECAFYAVDQLMLGNRSMKVVYDRLTHHISKLATKVALTTMWDQNLKIMERLGEKYHDATV